ncbi:TetR/AcrR family transcriptional regulator [Chachezhania antarctica]|uniref:TetR/AcrR family transcriptional regulator n=1 Tax=Chachezhania antarctica TaxID=2340860 RepID=UPI000EAC2C2B|nr:TetR/AcrR family transcriptional regulator [Chachezhania antarctica]|tara:strand:- start:3417 stop:4025 length:609 start_codon:yes stop_codon:yes gene_type:complete
MTQDTKAHPAPKAQNRGDLKARLVKAGLDILDEDGIEALTLRACAARAGVSHAAPAHHFDGMPGLVTAIATEGYRLFAATMIEVRDRAPATPRDRLIGICRGYMRFAEENTGLFTLMFNTSLTIDRDAAFQAAARASYAVLAEACAPFRPVSQEPRSTETMIWSLIHGLASLTIAGRLFRPDVDLPSPDIADILPDLPLKAG